MNLNHLTLFLHIVEKGSLAAAGRELGLSATTVSDQLATLERYYGVTLLNRTTRAISLTEEGRTLLDGARHLLLEAEELDHLVRFNAQTLSGLIRISAPIDLGHTTIEPIINQFLQEHPQITIELILTDSNMNIVDEGIDIAIRQGKLTDSTLRARSLGKTQRVVCASPHYLDHHQAPKQPSDLTKHHCLLMRFGTQLDNIWHFKKNNKNLRIHVNGHRIANDGRLVREWCLKGYGIALKSFWDVKNDLKAKKLILLLEEYHSPPADISMVFPPSRTQPRRVQVLADRLSNAVKQ